LPTLSAAQNAAVQPGFNHYPASEVSMKLHPQLRIALGICVLTLFACAVSVPGVHAQTATLSATTHTFGSLAVSATSGTSTVRLTNSGTAALTGIGISASTDFAQTHTCGTSLAGHSNCTISITFTPTVIGAVTGAVTITDALGNQSISLSGTGAPPISVSPISRALGSVALGQISAAKTFTVTNKGASAQPIAITVNSTTFGETDTCGGIVPGSGNCVISATFSPPLTGVTAGEQITGAIDVSYGIGATHETTVLSLTGTPIEPITVTPTSRALGSVAIGQTSAAKTFTVTNRGTASQNLTITSSSPEFAASGCTGALAGGATCTLSATFTPGTGTTGQQTGTITVGDTAGTIPLSLTGTPIAPVTVSPTSIAFSTTLAVGTPSAAHTVTINNKESVALSNLSIVASPSSYAITGGTCGSATSIAASSSCTVTLVFTPAASGSIPGTLTISDAAVGSPQVVNLTGAGALDNLVSVAITVPDASLPKGTTEQLQAIGTYRSGKTGNVTSSTTWGTGSAAIASVSTTGVVTGTGLGGTTITAAVTGTTVTGSTPLTVSAPLLTSIAVSAPSTTLDYPGTLQFAATGTYSDGTTGDVTTTAAWNSTNTAAATIGTGGMATAMDPSISTTTNITAALSGITSSPFTLTVVNAAPTLQSIVISAAQGSTTPATPTVASGMSTQLYATGVYSNNSTQDLTTQVSWTSTADASVSNTSGSQGLVTGTGVGTPTVTATLGSVSGNVTVNVTAAILQSIAITTPTTISNWPAGTTQQFTAAGTFSDGTTQNVSASVTWAVSNGTGNATITTTGLATGLTAGTVTISASATGVPTASTATLTIGPAALTGITVNPSNPSVALGTNETFTATGTYTNGTTADVTASVTWTATPNSSGGATFPTSSATPNVATATVEGVVTITATSASGPVGTTQMTITAPVLESIAITPTSATIYQGATQQFTATGTYTNGTTQDLTATATWGTNSGAVATISTASPTSTTGGLASGVGGGSVTITATSGSIVSPPVTLNVTGITSLAVTPANPTVYLGDANSSNPVGLTNNTVQFAAAVTYTDSTTAVVTTTANWTASTALPVVATISSTAGSQGLATILTTGTSMISATYAGVTGSTTLTVSPALLESIAITPSSVTLAPMGTQQFAATGTYSDGSTQNLTTSVTWASATPTSVSITPGPSGGLAEALAYNAGVAITASELNAADTLIISPAATVLVPAPTLLSIAVTPPAISLAAGYTQQYTATGTYSDASTQPLTTAVTWASSTPSFASITSGGLASTLKVGTTTISATSGTTVGQTTLLVTAPVLVSIAVTPASVSLGLNATQQYVATGTYSDGSTAPITGSVTWTSGNTTIATISSAGLATVVATSTSAVPITASTTVSGTLITSPPSWLSALSTLPVVCSAPTIDMKILVVNNAEANSGAGYADFPAIQQILNYVGTPYDVVDVTAAAPTLSDTTTCHGYYQGVIFAYGGDYYSIPTWQSTLISYEQTFNVRQINWYDFPDPNFGLTYQGTQIPSTETYTANFTAAAVPVFFYANTNTPLTITNAAVDLATADAASGGTLTPLLQDAQGNIVSAIYDYNGQQFLTQTFDSNQYLMHDLIVAYGLLNWVTQGVFLGDYHVYATQSIDDFFIDDSEWIPSTACLSDPQTLDRTLPDASNLPVFRVNSSDMTQLAAWQKTKQSDPLLTQFELTIAMNGVGTTGNGDWSGLIAPIVSSSSGSGIATFTAQDFSGLVGQTVTVTNTKNAAGNLNGAFTITSVTSSAATTPGTTTFTVSIPGVATAALAAENGVTDNPQTATASVADDLTANLQSFQGSFHWISHTYDHPSTLNGLCQSLPDDLPTCGDSIDAPNYTDDIDLEVLTNRWVASDPAAQASWMLDMDTSDTVKQLVFTDFNPANIVTPGVTGLNDPNVPSYLYNDGIRNAVSDTSVATITTPPNNNGPNPSPNVGIVNSYAPGIYEVPRHPNDVFYNVANWADDQAEFDCVYTYYIPPDSPAGTLPALDPPFNTYNAAQVLDFTSSAFVTNMLMGDMDPEMFHQPDLHFSDNYANLTKAAPSNTLPASVTTFLGTGTSHVSSLLSDTYDLTFSKYEAVYKLPVLTPPMDQIAGLMQNRNSFNLSGVTASIVGAGTPSAMIMLTMPASTTLTNAIIPITGVTSTGSEVYGGQNISHITIGQGTTINLPLN
jgi:Bacterial Ig-like domain (group 2)